MTFQVQFTAPVTNVTSADFVVAGDGVTGTVEPVVPGPANASGYYTTCTVTVDNIAFTAGTGHGTLGLDLVDDNSIVDANGDALGGPAPGDGSVTGPSYTIDDHLYYDATVGGTWNSTNQNWRIGGITGPLTAWVPYSNAIIPGSAVTVAIASGATVTANSVTFQGSGDSLSGGTVDFGLGGGAIDVEGASASVSSTIVGAALAKTGPGAVALTANDASQTEIDQGRSRLAAQPVSARVWSRSTPARWRPRKVLRGPVPSSSTVRLPQSRPIPGTFTMTGPLSGNGTVAIAGGGTTKLSGDLTAFRVRSTSRARSILKRRLPARFR